MLIFCKSKIEYKIYLKTWTQLCKIYDEIITLKLGVSFKVRPSYCYYHIYLPHRSVNF